MTRQTAKSITRNQSPNLKQIKKPGANAAGLLPFLKDDEEG